MPQTRKITILEDDAMISAMYKTKLEASGYEVRIFENGYEGLQDLKKDPPDLAMLDIMMPQLDGFSVLRELRKEGKTKNLPILMLTNLGTDADVEKGKAQGATDYIIKANFTPAQVVDLIQKYLK